MAEPLREPLWLDGVPDLSNDPLLETAYAVSEWAITYVGPIFWICLGCLFLVAEFGGWIA
jgi:hypothetical protein